MNKLMIDLETLATTPDAAVVAIGAVVFDDEKVLASAYWPLKLVGVSGYIDGETVGWWMQQTKEAQQVTFGGETRYEAYHAATEFCSLLDEWKPEAVWANDPDFDLVVLKNWWHRYRTTSYPLNGYFAPAIARPWPFKYNAGRSYRTLRETAAILGWTEEMNGAARGTWLQHSAADDAAAQARAVIAMRQFIANHIRASI